MNNKSYGPVDCIGKEQKDLRMIDNECASCLYEAGKLSQKDVLGAVIANELSQDELVQRFFAQQDFCGIRIAS